MSATPYHPQFFTATILECKHLLKPDKYKKIIIERLRFVTKEKKVEVSGYVIMSNHMYLICQIQQGHKKENVQRDFLKFIGQRIKDGLIKNHPKYCLILNQAQETGNINSGKGTA